MEHALANYGSSEIPHFIVSLMDTLAWMCRETDTR